ncbi:MAG: RICIN domain-containing protein [Bifidobacterium sp.]|uniref:RICIN domain-containing protein n=1 Tax=Bifidobacterium sp. TaxID=41200 RepID=UPI003F0C6FD2
MAWKKMRSVVATAAAVMICAGVLASWGTSGSAADKTIDTVLSASASSNGIDSTSVVTATDDTSGTTGTDTMPSNPSQELPDSVDSSIPNNATVVSSDLAVTKDGTVKNLETGETVTDPEIVGTEDTPPDPLAKTNGQRFIPVSVKTVRNAIEERTGTEKSALKSKALASAGASMMPAVLKSSTGTSVQQTALQNNNYGAHWGTYDGTQAFFEYDSKNERSVLFAKDAKGVIDVSENNGTIDWSKVKASGVQGAIIRLGFGWGNRFDYQALRNISECKRLGIPFGIYWYSYAYEASQAAKEAGSLVSQLRQAGVSPSDLSYPVFYDLEKWTWTGHTPPTSASVYQSIVSAWWQRMQAAGYSNLSVYSYASYLNGPLNTSDIHSKTHWAASYGARVGFTFGAGLRGWQYWSSGSIPGIAGNVDLNAFGNVYDVRTLPTVTIPNGTYYINAMMKDSSGIDIPGASTSNGARTQLYQANGSSAQKFVFTKQSDGSYVITNALSGKALDVASGLAGDGAVVQQYTPNGTKAQRWYIRDTGSGYCIQSALGNWVLDIASGSSANGTSISLYTPNASKAQKFTVSSATAAIPTNVSLKISSVENASLAMDVPGASTQDGARIQIYQANGSNAQTFSAQQVGNGVYSLTNTASGKVLDVAGASTANGGVVQQYASNGTAAQHWSLLDYGNGKISLTSNVSGKAVDIPSGNASSSVKLQIYSANGTKAQQWTVTRVKSERDKLNDLAAKNKGVLADGTMTMISALSASKALDVSGASRSNCANVQLYQSNGTGAQRWIVSHDRQGYVTLRNAASGKVLDIAGASTANGTNVQQYDSNGTWAQKWIAVSNGDGTVTLHSALKYGLVLDVAGASRANGANVQVYASNGTRAQRWVRK